ncbi:hypothetical protein BKA65DRAFT_57986 [Rhexocercosporidium sp. MPI-PUGE-AT-0058]|nr:hypothetical protein BKA65DRAFT_57986 [Rhexocercosporidium sp. MPI-PUGE-AT-0058]
MSNLQTESSSSSISPPTMSTPASHPPSPGTNTPPATPKALILIPIDYRIPTPPDLHTVSRCVSDLLLSASLAAKLATYITHPKSLSLSSLFTHYHSKNKNKKKNHDLSSLKIQLIEVLSEFARAEGVGKGFDVEEFGKMFSSSKCENRSHEFMMEVARCEGVKECLEYACCTALLSNETRIRENIVEALSHALANKEIPRYVELITEAEDILHTTTHVIADWTVKLKSQVKHANMRLAAVPMGGEEWEDDYETFAAVKKEARGEFAKFLGL